MKIASARYLSGCNPSRIRGARYLSGTQLNQRGPLRLLQEVAVVCHEDLAVVVDVAPHGVDVHRRVMPSHRGGSGISGLCDMIRESAGHRGKENRADFSFELL